MLEEGAAQDGTVMNGALLGAEGPSPAVPFALELDGTNDYVAVADPEDLWAEAFDEPFSWLAWINGDDWTSAVSTIVGKGAGAPLLYVDDEGYLTLAESGGDIVAKASIAMSSAAWHHVAAVVTDETATLYVDGVDVTGEVAMVEFANTEDALGIGSATGESGSNVFDGSISSVVWGNELNAGEARDIHRFRESP